jgi:CheY-like chemotaxis protein
VNTILLVEDSRFLRATNEKALVRAGYRVVTACDGEEALRVAGESCPDLILLDMLLPKLSGQEVLRSLRSTPPTTKVPIVVLSSLPQSNEERLKKDGATAYFDKASLGLEQQSESLVQIVRKTLEKSKRKEGSDAASLAPNGEA